MEENKKIHSRETLKKFFKNGQIPNETHFSSLIDSVIVQHDDGISKDEKNGYSIAPLGSSSKLMTFYENIDRVDPLFFVEKDLLDSPSVKFRSGTTNNKADNKKEDSFYFHQNGNLGIGKKSNLNFKVDINGFSASQGRIGNYSYGTIPADGKWHDITPELDNCQAFEIIARTGKKKSGRFSLLHATALSTFGKGYGIRIFGKSHPAIRKTRAYWGSFWSVWNKLDIRWDGTTHKYTLQLRSNSKFGTGVDIYYNVIKLWDDELFLPEDECYPTNKNVFNDK